MKTSALSERLTNDVRWQATAAGLLVAIVLMWGWYRLGSAQAVVDGATQQFRAVARDVERISDLRRRTVALAGGARLGVDLVTRAQRALSSVGLPTSACQGVQPRADQPAAAGGPRMQSVELLLSGLTPGEFGSWMSAWNTADQPWRVREIVLNHQAPTLPGQETARLDSNRFQISVLLSAYSVEESP